MGGRGSSLRRSSSGGLSNSQVLQMSRDLANRATERVQQLESQLESKIYSLGKQDAAGMSVSELNQAKLDRGLDPGSPFSTNTLYRRLAEENHANTLRALREEIQRAKADERDAAQRYWNATMSAGR